MASFEVSLQVAGVHLGDREFGSFLSAYRVTRHCLARAQCPLWTAKGVVQLFSGISVFSPENNMDTARDCYLVVMRARVSGTWPTATVLCSTKTKRWSKQAAQARVAALVNPNSSSRAAARFLPTPRTPTTRCAWPRTPTTRSAWPRTPYCNYLDTHLIWQLRLVIIDYL